MEPGIALECRYALVHRVQLIKITSSVRASGCCVCVHNRLSGHVEKDGGSDRTCRVGGSDFGDF